MNPIALLLMILVQVSVTGITVYLLRKAGRSGFKRDEEDESTSAS
ncbi:MAG: hypothetical protein R2751_04425 [Bacteroidales bacterium]